MKIYSDIIPSLVQKKRGREVAPNNENRTDTTFPTNAAEEFIAVLGEFYEY